MRPRKKIAKIIIITGFILMFSVAVFDLNPMIFFLSCIATLIGMALDVDVGV